MYGNLGESRVNKISVAKILFGDSKLVNSLSIAAFSMLFGWILAIIIGICSVVCRYSIFDRILSGIGTVGLALPNFLIALLFSWFMLRVFHSSIRPNAGFLSPISRDFWLLVIIVGTSTMPAVTRHLRSGLLDVLSTDYIRAARAKGLAEKIIVCKHALKNAINPLISGLGLYIPLLFESMIVVAAIFKPPIVELPFLYAFMEEDTYVIMAGLIFFGSLLLLGSLLADLLLLWSNPKIRYEG